MKVITIFILALVVLCGCSSAPLSRDRDTRISIEGLKPLEQGMNSRGIF